MNLVTSARRQSAPGESARRSAPRKACPSRASGRGVVRWSAKRQPRSREPTMMQTRTLGERPRGLRDRPRLHGHEPVSYAPFPSGRDDRAPAEAVEHGVTFFDTAEVYGPYVNEELVGEALEPFRGQVVIATKFGFELDARGGPAVAGLDSRPEHIREVAEASLRRLRVDAHRPVLPAPGRPGGADRGRRRDGERPHRRGQGPPLRPVGGGRRRRSGARTPSSRSPRSRASTRCGPAARSASVLPTLEELGIGFVPFSPLGKGFLTGAIDETTTFERDRHPHDDPAVRRRRARGEPGAGRPAARRSASGRAPRPRRSPSPGCSPSKPWIVPIPGTRRLERLDENIGGREPRPVARRPPGDRRRRPRHHRPGRPLPRVPRAADRPLDRPTEEHA